jgi:hypothetical protein
MLGEEKGRHLRRIGSRPYWRDARLRRCRQREMPAVISDRDVWAAARIEAPAMTRPLRCLV